MRRMWSRAAAVLLCAGMLTGCNRLMTWTIFDTVHLLEDRFGGNSYHSDGDWSDEGINESEDSIMDGQNVCMLEAYPLD